MLGIVSTETLKKFLQDLVNKFKNRFYNSDYGEEAADYISNVWQEITKSREDIYVSEYSHNTIFSTISQQDSIILKIKGEIYPDKVVIIGAHLDSILEDEASVPQTNPQMKAPGADNNGAGISLLTEVIRAIVFSGYRPRNSIEIMAIAAAEPNLLGSNDIASYYKSKGREVLGMLSFDKIGYKDKHKATICFGNDKDSDSDQTNYLIKLMGQYLPDVSHGIKNCKEKFVNLKRVNCSDNTPFTNNGFPATMVSECEFSPHHNKESDNITHVNIDQVSEFTKLALAYIAERGGGKQIKYNMF